MPQTGLCPEVRVLKLAAHGAWSKRWGGESLGLAAPRKSQLQSWDHPPSALPVHLSTLLVISPTRRTSKSHHSLPITSSVVPHHTSPLSSSCCHQGHCLETPTPLQVPLFPALQKQCSSCPWNPPAPRALDSRRFWSIFPPETLGCLVDGLLPECAQGCHLPCFSCYTSMSVVQMLTDSSTQW